MKCISLPLAFLGLFVLVVASPVKSQTPQESDVYVSPASDHRILFKPGDPVLARLQTSGAVWHVEDYASFVLAIVDERLAGGRAALLSLGLPIRDDQAVIGINGALLDTADRDGLAARLASIPSFLRAAEMGAGAPPPSNMWIVQFIGPIREEWLGRLTSTGAVIVTPMATNGYVVNVDGASLPAFAAFEKDPSVQWIGAYHPFFRLDPELRALDFARSTPIDLTIQLVVGESASALIDALGKAGFPLLRPTESVLDYVNVHFSIPTNLLPALAAHPAVFGIEPLPEVRMNDEVQGQILAGNLNPGLSGPAAPGYLAWLATKGFSSSGQFAFAVDVTDDGIDRGSLTDVNDEFRVLGAGGVSRVVYVHNYTSDPLADSGDGHGNINASIIFGYSALTGGPYQDANGYNYGLGVCPFVQVGATKVFNNAGAGQFQGSTATRLSAAYSAGARFSSNSWGSVSGNSYNSDCQAHDTVVRDATTATGNQEMTIVFAAGNSGSGANTVHPPGTAKNIITVGASENNRQTGTDGCGIANSGADNAMDIISFSSRGPCSDGRKKPDICAPGTHIQGAASRSLSYDGSGVCNQYWPSGQTLYAWSSGTSHSTPATAGASALVRQDFINKGLAAPSPAMVKASLMTSARYMTGVGANNTLWSTSQGLGLVDLGRAFDNEARILVDQTQVFGATGQTYVVTGSIVSSVEPFRVGLVWTDAPGPTTGNAYVNNLDLQVAVNGATYLGNVFSGANSVTGGAADAKNNAEFVFLPAGTTGSFTVTVLATNIAGNGVPGNADTTDQDFALVISNGTTCSTVTITTQPASQTVCTGLPATFSVGASGAGLSYQWRKNGSNIALETGPSYTIPAVASGDAGNYDVVVTSGCSITSAVATLTVSVAPGITVQPAGGVACLGLSKSLSVTATGTGPLSFQWHKDGLDINGATSSSYVIASVSSGDAGSYDVLVTNACGSTLSNPAVLTIGTAVSITTQPSPLAVCPGAPVAFSVAATGSPPLTYQWQKNAANIVGATSATYSIAAAVAGDAGTYSAVVSNGCGPLASSNAALTVGSGAGILLQPSPQTVCAGGGAAFSAFAIGTAPISYQWRKDGVAINGATSSSFSIASTVVSDAGGYSVLVSNACGSMPSNSVMLTVNTAPSVTVPPSGQTACLGTSASFSVSASGSPSPTYQWRKNASNIGGATSATYAIASVAAGDVGSYDVVVTNSCGSATSAPASLTLGAPMIAGLVPSSIGVMPPMFAPLTITVNGSCFLASSVVFANGVPLSTTFLSPMSLSCLLVPSVAQSELPGAICMNVQNTVTEVSNTMALAVGTGNNAGTIRRQPLAPSPGETYAIVLEGGLPFAPFSLFADLGSVTPVTGFPDSGTNFVLAVSPLTGSAGPLVTVFDGLGVFGPPSGTAYDASGRFVIPGIIVPNPLLGVSVTIQAAYVDPSSPAGFRLTWARFPEEI